MRLMILVCCLNYVLVLYILAYIERERLMSPFMAGPARGGGLDACLSASQYCVFADELLLFFSLSLVFVCVSVCVRK